MELYILRHGIAVERGTAGYKDSERPLTKEGEDRLHQIAQAMLAMELKFDLIMTSPLIRAAKTAQIVAGEFDQEVTSTDLLKPNGNHLALIGEINHRTPQRVLIVGHEPDLSRLISLLTTGVTAATIELKKGGLCKMTAKKLSFGHCATLNWLLTPRHLRSLR